MDHRRGFRLSDAPHLRCLPTSPPKGAGNHYWFNGAQYALALRPGSPLFLVRSPAPRRRITPIHPGLLASAGNNVLRFDYDPVALTPKGILLEGASTNQLTHSQLDSGWTTTRGTLDSERRNCAGRHDDGGQLYS